ncbi:MAG: DNA polymerase III, subunit gamma and tau [Candidatus Woykebacteria bacterium RBG_16_43_9]|uniref:DNA polymerase III subunit gamma/tau n=1 Tax=Candidatus Woykebacteria bacterium RBG_16_43_9 TaxID=1802596 RepID=A0A1G1WC50_9BACT|nr:MAG: DNA polymerase III, subunit gamma and tau [Candidatus Woykebacteria bacterium RBG_16_43_9]
MVLYRKYRPQTLAEVMGQDHVREPLLATLSSGKISHAFLFTGPRGTGKTSIARILAKAVNCEKNAVKKGDSWQFSEPCNICNSCKSINEGSHLDIMEIDAASNRGIDEIRDLREKIKLLPASGNFKVYIIDEAHMLTSEAFNALLKTLEEPPEHSVFVLATTEPQKIPATIASRSTRYDFKVPNVDQIKAKLHLIAKQEGWAMPPESLEEISKMAGGAFRDAEVLLEKVSATDTSASLEKTREILGKREIASTIEFLKLITGKKTKEALIWLDEYLKSGGSVRVLTEAVLDTLRKILLLKAGADVVVGFITQDEIETLIKLEKEISKSEMLKLIDLFNVSISELRDASIPQLPIEIAIIEATSDKNIVQEEDIVPSVKGKVTIISTTDTKENSQKGGVEKELEKEIITSKKEVKNQNKILKKLQEKWPQFLKEIKATNSSVEMFLRSANPVDIDEDLVIIEFVYKFHKGKIEERKYRDIVEKALEKFTGAPMRIKGVVSTKAFESKNLEVISGEKQKDEIDPVSVFGTLD